MPLIEIRRLNKYTLLGRWALTETAAQLQELPQLPVHLIIPDNLTHEKRRAEWLASRLVAYLLLQQFTPEVYLLDNQESGKPHFVNSPFHVSLTHTQHEVAVILSGKYEVGIDIESIKPKIQRVRDRFLSSVEKEYISDDLIQLTIAWSAKETLYKIFGKKSIIFAEHLHLAPFVVSPAGSLPAKIITDSFTLDYTIYFQFSENTVLTYCVHPDTNTTGLSLLNH